ncbi:hypothetical protein SALB1_0566 [Salinisphaera sp. LB1]|nr:hypothetical protein SALB1_0566 [Salinisphaera sp. LB1]
MRKALIQLDRFMFNAGRLDTAREPWKPEISRSRRGCQAPVRH